MQILKLRFIAKFLSNCILEGNTKIHLSCKKFKMWYFRYFFWFENFNTHFSYKNLKMKNWKYNFSWKYEDSEKSIKKPNSHCVDGHLYQFWSSNSEFWFLNNSEISNNFSYSCMSVWKCWLHYHLWTTVTFQKLFRSEWATRHWKGLELKRSKMGLLFV